VYGTGENIREWINVEDHCSAIEFVLARGIPGEVYNVGSGFYLKNIEIVKVILDLLGKSHTLIEFVPDRPGHDLIYRVDWSKIQTDLQWNPQKSNIKYLLEVVKNYASLV
jgi:dTDP-glucose 4,6-dehydratase